MGQHPGRPTQTIRLLADGIGLDNAGLSDVGLDDAGLSDVGLDEEPYTAGGAFVQGYRNCLSKRG